MFVSQRIALDPNNNQETHFRMASGTARFAYNWALAAWREEYASGWKPSAFKLCRAFNAIKGNAFPWASDVSARAAEAAILNLGTAYDRFFKKMADYPQFKKKGVRDAFEVPYRNIIVEQKRARIPKLGWVKTRQPLRFQGKIKKVYISRQGHRWFLSVAIETENPFPQSENQAAVGVDLGVTTLATLSTGEKLTGPKPHNYLLGRLRRLNRSLARKVKGSRNRDKAKRKLSRLHARIGNIRQDALHRLTHRLTRDFGVIGIESLNVAGMVKNHNLARAVSDMGFHEFKRQLTYKAEWRCVRVVEADTFYPSSKTCSACRRVMETLPLSVREWECRCGALHDRDVNAAINLRNKAVEFTASACGEESSGRGSNAAVKLASMKQEPASPKLGRRRGKLNPPNPGLKHGKN